MDSLPGGPLGFGFGGLGGVLGGLGGFRGLGCRVLRCRVEGLGWYIGFGFRAEGCLGF